jgi:uncharacterized protein (TIGR03435 family)
MLSFGGPRPDLHNFLGRLEQSAAQFIQRPVKRLGVVKDARYEFVLSFSPGDVDPPDVFSALPQLGLKLASKKAPVDIIVIAHAERTPSAN